MEEAPVRDHQANAASENAVKNAQGQFRALKDALDSRINKRNERDHRVVPWMVMHAATVITKGRRDDEGCTPHRRWKEMEFNRQVASSGIPRCTCRLRLRRKTSST